MKTTAALLLLLSVPALVLAADPVKAADPDKKEWVSLFDGKSLAGWIPKITGYDACVNYGETFRVEDWVLNVVYDKAKYDILGSRFVHLIYMTPFSHYVLPVHTRFMSVPAYNTPPSSFR